MADWRSLGLAAHAGDRPGGVVCHCADAGGPSNRRGAGLGLWRRVGSRRFSLLRQLFAGAASAMFGARAAALPGLVGHDAGWVSGHTGVAQRPLAGGVGPTRPAGRRTAAAADPASVGVVSSRRLAGALGRVAAATASADAFAPVLAALQRQPV